MKIEEACRCARVSDGSGVLDPIACILHHEEDGLLTIIGWLHEAIERVDIDWDAWRSAKDPVVAAHHLIQLSDAMSDLRSWHPSHDIETSTLGWERTEDA